MRPSKPQFPIYIPSKGRSQYMLTSKALAAMGVAHTLVVEPQEVDAYRAAIDRLGLAADVLELDLGFKDRYELCDKLGRTKSTGPGPARNFAWEHSKAAGADWHWVMDDNIRAFYRWNDNLKVPTTAPGFWVAMEEFAQRYENLAMCGPNYFMFASRKTKAPPFVANTRIYSCNLIRNSVKQRWRGRYNEDTILSLDLLKAGWCTVQFNAFLQEKLQTQTIGGGNTAEFYKEEGTAAKSQMIVDVHPDVSKLAFRFKRAHHHVDYGRFRGLKLRFKPGAEPAPGVDNFGMRLVQVAKA